MEQIYALLQTVISSIGQNSCRQHRHFDLIVPINAPSYLSVLKQILNKIGHLSLNVYWHVLFLIICASFSFISVLFHVFIGFKHKLLSLVFELLKIGVVCFDLIQIYHIFLDFVLNSFGVVC
jgi:hypothetical protein